MRGRNRSKGPNPLTRTYESNGPDVKIRGTAQHIADKYAQLARDATVSGDPVSAENYLQHAEHYYRMIAAAQEAYRQQFGTPQRPFDDEGEEGDEEGGPNGYPYGQGDRNGAGGDDFADGFPGQPYEGRPSLDRPPQQRFDRNDRPDRQGDRGSDRQGDRGQRFDRNGERFDRGDRNDRGERNDRFERGGERFDRNARGPGGERGHPGERGANGQGQNGERFDRGERGDNRERFGRGEGGRQDGGRRDREFGRNDRQGGQPRSEPQRYGSAADEAPEAVAGGLPAFLTAPVRAPITVGEADRDEPAMAAPAPYGNELELGQGQEAVAEPRPRRARRPRRADPAGALDFESGAPEADKPAE